MAEPSISFHHAGSKIEWAKQHISHFNTASKSWLDRKPYSIELKTHPDTGEHHFEVGLAEPMPVWVPLAMGDICGNLRASLDYMWMGLVRAATPGNPSKKTLPIADNRKGLVATIAQAPIGAAIPEAERLLADEIRAHRDFADGGNQGLIALNELSNWNKHNLLVATAAVTQLTNVQLGGLRIGQLRVKGGIGNVAVFAGHLAQPKLQYDDDPTVEIVFGQHDIVSGEPVVPTLLNFAQFCSETLKAFREAFLP
jgi:hypothetical protein